MAVHSIEKELELKELKMELIQLLIQIDELGLLQKIRKEITLNKQNEVVGYSANGKPITQKKMEKEIRTSLKQAEEKDGISLEELEKESESW